MSWQSLLVVMVDGSMSVGDRCGRVMLHHWDWVSVDGCGLVNDCVEAIVVIGSVVNGSD